MEEFFVPCTKQEESEVVNLLQELGYKEWGRKCAMDWGSGDYNGLKADISGDYFVYMQRDHHTIVTIEELRQMASAKRFEDFLDKMPDQIGGYSGWLPIPTTPQNQIPYHVIKDLGFTEEKCYDSVHEREHGYPYKIFYLNLTKRISLDWNQVTRRARIIRSDKDGWIKNQKPITSEKMLRTIVSFFKEDKQ